MKNTLTFKVVQETNGVVTATTYSLDTGLNKLATVSSAMECVTPGVKYAQVFCIQSHHWYNEYPI